MAGGGAHVTNVSCEWGGASGGRSSREEPLLGGDGGSLDAEGASRVLRRRGQSDEIG